MNQPEHHKEFLRLVSENRHRIFGYIFSLTSNRADSEDLLQESIITMWEKFDEFDTSTNFIAWSFKIAYYKTRNFQRKSGNSKLVFDDDILDKIAVQFEDDTTKLDRRYEMLQQCLQMQELAARCQEGGGVA